ncbi:MAG: YkvA family protein [Synechococcaceae cyanobacterium]
MPMSAANSAAGSAAQTAVTAEVLQEGFVQEGVFAKLLRRAGRTIARPALECYEMLVDGATPHQARLTVLAALTYLMVPLDLIPDFLPAAGFSDDMVALTALLGLCSRHITPAIRTRAKDRLDRWFPLSR